MATVTPARPAGCLAPSLPVAFVLAGGASYAAAQVGMLRALHEAGIHPDLLVGASAGAINAAAYAADPTEQGIGHLEEAWRTARRSDLFPLRATSLLLGLTGRRNHLISAEALRRWLADHLGLDRLEDAAIAVHVVTTDLACGSPVVVSDGPAVPALLASSAIPGIFPPVAIGGRFLVDGGIAADSPVRLAEALGAQTIYLLPSHAIAGAPATTRSAFALGSYAYTQVFGHWTGDQAGTATSATVEILPVPVSVEAHPLDFAHSAELIASAADLTRRWLSSRADAPSSRAA